MIPKEVHFILMHSLLWSRSKRRDKRLAGDPLAASLFSRFIMSALVPKMSQAGGEMPLGHRSAQLQSLQTDVRSEF